MHQIAVEEALANVVWLYYKWLTHIANLHFNIQENKHKWRLTKRMQL